MEHVQENYTETVYYDTQNLPVPSCRVCVLRSGTAAWNVLIQVEATFLKKNSFLPSQKHDHRNGSTERIKSMYTTAAYVSSK